MWTPYFTLLYLTVPLQKTPAEWHFCFPVICVYMCSLAAEPLKSKVCYTQSGETLCPAVFHHLFHIYYKWSFPALWSLHVVASSPSPPAAFEIAENKVFSCSGFPLGFGNSLFWFQFCHDVLRTLCAMWSLHGVFQLRWTCCVYTQSL